MTKEMEQAVAFLYATPKFTTKNPLDHTKELMDMLGNPCMGRKVIHVAGSNGKGSVCCFLYHMLQAAGKTVSLFTSPHLVDVRERFQINGELVSEADFMEAYNRVKESADEMVREGKNHPTFFEFIFAMGMLMFEKADTEYVILETGLGGRLDATNSFPKPILSVITSISLEHTEILGSTLGAIAGEKAGIIKPGVPVIYDGNEIEAAAVIRNRAQDLGSLSYGIASESYQLRELGHNYIDFSLFTDYNKKIEWRIPFSATYQMANASLAIAAMGMLQRMPEWNKSNEITENVDDFSTKMDVEAVMQEGLLRAVWPGRMQEVLPEVFFDGAHNTSGISVFLNAVRQLVAEDEIPPMLLFSMVKDKDYHTSIAMLTSEIPWDAMAVTRIPNERGIDYEELQQIFEEDSRQSVMGYEDYQEAFTDMCRRKKTGQKLFCTGSLYFVGSLMEVLTTDGK